MALSRNFSAVNAMNSSAGQGQVGGHWRGGCFLAGVSADGLENGPDAVGAEKNKIAARIKIEYRFIVDSPNEPALLLKIFLLAQFLFQMFNADAPDLSEERAEEKSQRGYPAADRNKSHQRSEYLADHGLRDHNRPLAVAIILIK